MIINKDANIYRTSAMNLSIQDDTSSFIDPQVFFYQTAVF
jgi:hypothetical protein